MSKQIHIAFGAESVAIQTTGYTGPTCVKAQAKIRQELGLEKARELGYEKTAEYNLVPAPAQVNQSGQA